MLAAEIVLPALSRDRARDLLEDLVLIHDFVAAAADRGAREGAR